MLIGEDRGHYLLILVIIPEEITRNWKQWKKLNFRVEHKLWKEISYLQAAINYFVSHINTIALYWQEKSTFLMYENKRIDNPPNKSRKVR